MRRNADPVRYAAAQPSGLATMVGQLVTQNIERDPDRLELLTSGVVTIGAPDAGVAITLRFTPGRLEVSEGADPDAPVAIRADSGRLLALVGAPLLLGLPDVFTSAGRAVVADLVGRRVVVHGLVRHPIRVSRLTRLLSVHERSIGHGGRR